MIVYPRNWQKGGRPITLEQIETAILNVLSEIDCSMITLSGGLDSSLILYYMSRQRAAVTAFTIAASQYHPDAIYSQLIVSQLPNVKHILYIPTKEDAESMDVMNDMPGDSAVRLLYRVIAKHTDSVVACDGIDEFLCGYYTHRQSPTEKIYYQHLRELQDLHLIPLDKNSGSVNVYLPYLAPEVVSLFSQIPVSEKVDSKSRKKVLVGLAQGKLPDAIINRRKYGFNSALSNIKEEVR